MLNDARIKKLRQKSYLLNPLWRELHRTVVNFGEHNEAWLHMPGDEDCQYAWTMMVMMGFEETTLEKPAYRNNSAFKLMQAEWLSVPDPNPTAHEFKLRCATRTRVMYTGMNTGAEQSDTIAAEVIAQVYGNPFLIYQFNWSHIGLHMAKGAHTRAAE